MLVRLLEPTVRRAEEGRDWLSPGRKICWVVGYADNLLLLAPSRNAAQLMLKIGKKFTGENSIQFSTDIDPFRSKSKAIYMVGPRGANLP